MSQAMFRRAVSVLEGVKADSLFSYQPPINIFALCILFPASYVLSARWFHKVNVFLIRVTNFPILLSIAWYERQRKLSNSHGFYDTVSAAAETLYDKLPRPLKRLSLFEGLAGADADIDIIFEVVEDSEEAVDTENYADRPLSQAALQRRISRKSDSRPSRSPLRPSHSRKERTESRRTSSPSTNQASVPPRSSDPARHTSTPMALRRRLNSMFNRTDALQSPLAQVFQPVVVDDEIPEELPSDKGTSLQPHSSNGHIVSYGPASRRRLTSMHLASKRGSDSTAQASGTSRRPTFPAIDTRPEILVTAPLSASPDRQPETAEEVEESMGSSGGLMELSQRIRDMEDRQKRIENILIQLSERLQN